MSERFFRLDPFRPLSRVRRTVLPRRPSRRLRVSRWPWLTPVLLIGQLVSSGNAPAQDRPGRSLPGRGQLHPSEQRAIGFLSSEIPRWRSENRCFSCHNNGDGARALLAARQVGATLAVFPDEGTPDWLAAPEQWDANGPQGSFNDKRLALIQFAVAYVAAAEAGVVRDPQRLQQAGDLLAADQVPNGSWEFVGADEIGSPVTYGRSLATAMAARALRQVDPRRFASRIAAAETWMMNSTPRSVLNAAAVLWGLAQSTSPDAAAQRQRCLTIIQQGESPSGGWGPYVDSPTQPFDTAIVLCALATGQPVNVAAIRRGREYLKSSQFDDGSWPETTRPAEQVSYAQRLSTTGWATLALLATRSWEP